jgi:glycosyltransferase involved in cell wall biosynthesis
MDSPPERFASSVIESDAPSTVFDCSDLVHYFRDNRLPTGIQRVQINIIGNAVAAGAQRARIIFFELDGRGWHEISIPDFERLVNVAQRVETVSPRAWEAIRDEICGPGAPTYFFSQSDVLVNLGTSWWISDYFLMIRSLKDSNKIRYLPFIHDCIPLITPEYCAPGLTKQFKEWLYGVFRHSDGYLVNSQSTASDLVRIARQFGFKIPGPTVVRLDGDTRTGGHFGTLRSSDADLAHLFHRERLPVGAPFALMVSTLEARKNHISVLRIWDRMMSELGAERTPYLLCVGKEGWHFKETHDFLAARKSLLRRVRFISNLSDGVLSGLYDRCLFTLYPSHYEGWGLPVTESLCHGKVAVVSRNSSLAEAGGEFCDYFEPGSLNDFYDKAVRLALDADYRENCERRIRTEFNPRSWSQLARDVIAGVERLRDDNAPPFVSGISPLRLGSVYIMASHGSGQLGEGCVSGEDLRVGSDWHQCEKLYVWTGGREARLVFGAIQSPIRECVLFLGVGGNAFRKTKITISCPDLGREGVSEIEAHAHNDLVFPLGDIPSNGQDLNIILSCDNLVDLAEQTKGGDRRHIGFAVRWVALCEKSDVVGRLNVLETTRMTPVRPY